MDRHNLDRLEYHKIIARLEDCTSFGISREMAGELLPWTDINVIGEKQMETTEAREIIRLEPELPAGGLRDIRRLLRKAAVGGILEPAELMEVGDMLFAMRRLKNFFRDKTEKYRVVSGLASRLCALREVEDHINECIDIDGEVSDKASPELRRLRSRMRDLQASVKDRMDSIVRSPDYQKILQEPIVTMRGDRYVVPVKQEYRGQFPGIIHDQSASGATLFIEPMAVVEKNNELRRLGMEVQQEIVRILVRLTDCIREHNEEIGASVETAAEIDFIIARGKLSTRMDGGPVEIRGDRKLRFKGAKHPLIEGKAVPISVHLGYDFGIMVITGPNTGGKTVALKTVGLLVLMVQSGLHIPVEPGSETGVFQNVFADIGDEQSIEQSLSTFSSHMTNIINILDQVDNESLVLLDELGAGTDPAEGAALAMAVLDYLDSRKALVIATTHYSELKAFAFNRPGIENASVEFDIQTLRPTYKLNIGQPGSSSAFDIAGRLGLKREIIEVARQAMSTEEIRVTDLIRELEDNRRSSETDREEAARLKREVQKLKEEFERKLGDLSARKAEVMDKARQEAGEVLRKSRLEADSLLKEMKEAASRAADSRELSIAQEARSRLKKLRVEMDTDEEDMAYEEAPKEVRPGDEVFLPRYSQYGLVLSEPGSDGTVPLQVGVMKISLPLSELKLKKAAKAVETGAGRIVSGKAKEIKTEIDLRGLTVDETIEAVEKYLDDAYLAGLPKVYLIHGKGTGALRRAVKELLSGHRYVKTHRSGVYGEGGTGVTVVELE
ncbi:MAG: endonuclease MutS2 [Firmicutes bacterium HGW-Firmicutes-14]|nr:MAG: endonuclease MutS2 [Firmicutes bacterium HGW-Firmicutes-14]